MGLDSAFTSVARGIVGCIEALFQGFPLYSAGMIRSASCSCSGDAYADCCLLQCDGCAHVLLSVIALPMPHTRQVWGPSCSSELSSSDQGCQTGRFMDLKYFGPWHVSCDTGQFIVHTTSHRDEHDVAARAACMQVLGQPLFPSCGGDGRSGRSHSHRRYASTMAMCRSQCSKATSCSAIDQDCVQQGACNLLAAAHELMAAFLENCCGPSAPCASFLWETAEAPLAHL